MKPKGFVEGSSEKHDVKFYGISTCIWCKRTRQLLEEQDVTFDFVYVDLTSGDERKQVLEAVKAFNPKATFPTVVVDEEAVVGYKPDKLKELLNR